MRLVQDGRGATLTFGWRATGVRIACSAVQPFFAVMPGARYPTLADDVLEC